MTEQLIDLTEVDFWLICFLSVIVVTPLVRADARRVIWALVNVLFLYLLLGWNSIGILVVIPVLYVFIRGVASAYRASFTVLTAALIASLFFLHKLPLVTEGIGVGLLGDVLSIIGFSYVALRMIELLRAVFEGRHPPPDLFSLVNYLLPFHMLAAGPIQGYDEFANQPAVPAPLTLRDTLEATERIATGLFKKFVLAYMIQSMFLTDFEADGLYFFIEVQVFFFWLYLDFSAYSDMAVGIGRLLGIATPENFNRPYLARNAIDFWNRWHISLSQFIRRNLFIPLQLNGARTTPGHPLLVASMAFSVAFVLCGLWHGISLNFLLWGAIHALGLVVANLWREYRKTRRGREGIKKYMEDWRVKCV